MGKQAASRVSGTRRIACIVVAGALIGLAGVPGARAAEPFTIDVVLPLTGPAAFLGSSEQSALQAAEKAWEGHRSIAGRPIRFAFHDDQSSPQIAVQLATQIAAGKPPVVLGSAVVAMCNAMAPLMRRGPVLYCFSPGVYPAAGSFMFSSSNATKDLAAAQIRYFRTKGLTRLATISSTDASGQDFARNLKGLLALPENKDVQLVAETTFNPTDVSAAAQVERMKGANPQALIAWSTGAAIGTVFKAIQNSGLDIPIATTDGNMTYASMERYADILPKELLIPSPEWPRGTMRDLPAEVQAAKAEFFAAFPATTKPDAASSFVWDPALLVVTALNKLGAGATAEQLRAHLAGLTNVAGINGVYDFTAHPQRGLDDSNVVVTRWNRSAGTWDIVSGPRGVAQ